MDLNYENRVGLSDHDRAWDDYGNHTGTPVILTRSQGRFKTELLRIHHHYQDYLPEHLPGYFILSMFPRGPSERKLLA